MAQPRRWRPALLKVHRWVALSAGLLLMLNALTGLVLLGGRPLDEMLHPLLFKVRPLASRVALEDIRQALRAEFPTQGLTIWPGREPDDAMVVNVRDDKGWEGRVFIDPYTGLRLGVRDRSGLNLDGLFELHSSLLSGKTGKGALGILALCMAVMFLSGLAMWWPLRWGQAFTVVLSGARIRALFDLHRVGGATLGLWVLVCVATGGLLAYRPATQWINQAAGAAPLEAPKVPKSPPATAKPPTLDALAAVADAAVPAGETHAITLPAKPGEAVRIRKKLADDPHPIGLTAVWLNPRSGELLRIDRWDALPPGDRMFAWVYPLHSGQLAGAIGVVITAVGGLSLLGFGITGTWLWWLRRKKRPQPARAVASARA